MQCATTFKQPSSSTEALYFYTNMKSRLAFAREYINKDSTFYDTVTFADESKSTIFSSYEMSYVWHKANGELNKENLKTSVKHMDGHVVVCMSAVRVGSLIFMREQRTKCITSIYLYEKLGLY